MNTTPKVERRPRRLPILRCFALGLAVGGLLEGCSGTQLLNNLSLVSLLSPSGRYDLADDILFDAATGLKLDVYRPRNAERAPVVVFFFPGRWSMGDKSDYRFVAKGLNSRGIVAVLPNYRLYPSVRFPAFVQDAAQAVRWTHDHIAEYGGDPQKVFVMGHSSGAHLAAMLALEEDFLRKVGGTRGWLKGMIGLSGPYDFEPGTSADLADMFGPPENFALSQPVHYVDGGNPPMLLIHGHDDNAVSVENTIRLGDAIERAGGPVRTVLYPKLGHGWMVASLASYYRMKQGPLDMVDAFVHAGLKQMPGLTDTQGPLGGTGGWLGVAVSSQSRNVRFSAK